MIGQICGSLKAGHSQFPGEKLSQLSNRVLVILASEAALRWIQKYKGDLDSRA